VLGLDRPKCRRQNDLLRLPSGLIKSDGRITVCGRIEDLVALGADLNPILTGRENF